MLSIETAINTFVESGLWRHVLTALFVLIVTSYCSHLAKRALHKILDRPENPLPSTSLLVNIARVCIWAAGLCIILESCFGINPNAIVTALGVGGVALSLGLQDTISNLIGGIQITFMGIVRPGDNIEVAGERGIVQDVGLRHTTIKTSLGETVVIPNSVISKTSMLQLPPAEQFKVPFCITGEGHDLDEVCTTIAQRAKDAAEAVSHVTADPKVLLSEITEYGFKGSVVMSVADSSLTGRAADAVVRAIAPLTREELVETAS